MMNYLKGWSLFRALRLAIGLAILIQGILVMDYLFMFLGVWMAALPVLNVGCGCNTYGCSDDFEETDSATSEEVVFEEIK